MRVGKIEFVQKKEPWDVLDELRKTVAVDTARPANSFTKGEYASRYHLPIKTAGDHLTRLIQDGKLQSKKCLVDSKVANVYWIP